MKLTRLPAVSGTFYEEEPELLKQQIKSCFLSRFGPGELPKPRTQTSAPITAGIVPHAGFSYSGPCAAHFYKALAESKKPDIIIILGTGHAGLGKLASIWQGSDWETPLGIVSIDRIFLVKLKSDLFDFDLEPHLHEHSIEVQLPFLQFIYEKVPPIIPIIISAPLEKNICKKLGDKLASAIEKDRRNILLLASSDLTHYGVPYGYLPFAGPRKDVEKKLKELDSEAIKLITEIDPDGFIDYLKNTEATICGASPIAVLLYALERSRIRQGRILKYYTSGDLSGDYSLSVGYASIMFSK